MIVLSVVQFTVGLDMGRHTDRHAFSLKPESENECLAVGNAIDRSVVFVRNTSF